MNTQHRYQVLPCPLYSATDSVKVLSPGCHNDSQDIEGPGMWVTWRNDLRMCSLEKRMLWRYMITLFKYLKGCHEEEWLDLFCLAPRDTKLRLMDGGFGEGEQMLLGLQKDFWPEKFPATRCCAPQNRELWFTSGWGTQTVCPPDRYSYISQGPCTVDRGEYHSTTMISFQYIFI